MSAAQPLTLPSRANAVTRICADLAARRAEIRVRLRELETEVRRLTREDARLHAGEIMLGIETEDV